MEGSEKADNMAGRTEQVGAWMQKPEIATPAGIKQAFLIRAKLWSGKTYKPTHVGAASCHSLGRLNTSKGI